MRASRLVSMLILLQLRGRLTAEDLAREFEVSVRTIYRDADALSAAGIPIYADRGPGGGFALLDGYRTRLTGLTGAEAEALSMAGLPGLADSLGLGAAATAAGHKLLASLAPGPGAHAGRLASCFHLDAVDWYVAADPVPHLPALVRAALDGRVVRMRYDSWTGVRDWTVQPYGVVLKAGLWYAVAHGHGKVRTFRVASIHDLEVRSDPFERPRDFDLSAYWADSLRRFEAGLRPGLAVLTVSPDGCRSLAKLGAFATAAVAAAEIGPDGWRTVRLPIESVEQAAAMLLAIGPEFMVVEPDALRVRIGQLGAEVAARMALDAMPLCPGAAGRV